MAEVIRVRAYEHGQLLCDARCVGPFQVGRQRDSAEPLFQPRPNGGLTRIAIARLGDTSVPRLAVLIEPAGSDAVRLTNLSTSTPVGVQNAADLYPGASRGVGLPLLLTIGPRAVRVEREGADQPISLLGLAEATTLPGRSAIPLSFPGLAAGDGAAVLRWLRAALDVFQSAAGTHDLFDLAARAVIDSAGMDTGRVFLVDPSGEWRPYAPPRPDDLPASRHILERVGRESRTFWAAPESLSADSLVGVRAVVAAPILDRAGRVLGALYGDRRTAERPVTEAEARLVEVLAGGVAAGLARLDQERAALEARVRFEQFFSPELARELAARPDLLSGRDADVTVLFADVRGYSAASERLGPAGTVEWIQDVLAELSACVRDEDGVVVDYIGDEVLAMWGAPEPQADHAGRACRAALRMQERLPTLDARWRDKTGVPLGVGVGVHTGTARVGNVGTRYKFKYGPLGHTVNLASRVQGATKHLRTPLLVTGDTRARLGAGFALRRLTPVRVANIHQPVELFELSGESGPEWAKLRDDYEAALAAFEARELAKAARGLGSLLEAHPGDGPALLLLSRAVNALLPGAPPADAVWALSGK